VELRMAAAGPATSIAIAVGLILTAPILDLVGPQLVAVAVAWLGVINGILAVFNLLPAFPLDGGRMLRAYLWRRWTDKRRATVAAAKAGRYTAFVLIALGVLEFASGAGLGGLWLVLESGYATR
jgi:Zn-dependent protease